MNNEHNPLFYCRVCGFYHGYSVWGDAGTKPDYSICDCCGCEAGLNDETLECVRQYRVNWLGNGAVWFSYSHFVPLPGVTIKTQPDNWLLEKQLEQIPSQWR